MTDKIQSMTIILMTTILLSGGVVPYTFATGGDRDDDNRQCDCEKPASMTVTYNGPDNVSIEIYKNKKHIKEGPNDNKFQPALHTFANVNDGDLLTLTAQDVSKPDKPKDKLNSNTIFRILDGSGDELKRLSIHTSCSKPFYQGMQVPEYGGDYTLTVETALDEEGFDSIPENTMCEDNNPIPPALVCPGIEIKFDDNALTHGSQLAAINGYLESLDPFVTNDIVLSGVFNNGNHGPEPTLYNSKLTYNGKDIDLQHEFNQNIPQPDDPNVGNVVILPVDNIDNLTNEMNNPPTGGTTDGLIDNPNDSAAGGELIITFDPPRNTNFVSWIDAEDQEMVTITAFDGSNNPIGTSFSPTGLGDRTTEQVEIPAMDVATLKFDLNSSGGFTNLCVSELIHAQPPTLEVIKIINSEDPVNDPGKFNLFIETIPDAVAENVGHLGTSGAVVMTSGIFSVSETAGELTDLADYTTTFGGHCDEFGSITLSLNQEAVCEIINTPIPKPPTTMFTLKKALTTDNGGEAMPSNFEVTLTYLGEDEVLGGTDDIEFIESFDDISASMGEIVFEEIATSGEIPAGKYVLSELFVPAAESTETPADYTTVLVAGDTSCPSMEGEIFDLSENGKIICTIYNDDNGTISGGAGVVFHFGFVPFQVDDNQQGTGALTGFCDTAVLEFVPCIDFIGNSFIIIPDIDPADPMAQKLSETTLIQLTVLDKTFPTNFVGCQVTGVDDYAGPNGIPNNGDEIFDIDVGGEIRMGFIMKCPDLIFPATQDEFSANFALIETDQTKIVG